MTCLHIKRAAQEHLTEKKPDYFGQILQMFTDVCVCVCVCVQEYGEQAGPGSEAVLVGEDGPPWQDPPAPLPQPCQGWPHPHHTSTSTAYVMCHTMQECSVSPNALLANLFGADTSKHTWAASKLVQSPVAFCNL